MDQIHSSTRKRPAFLPRSSRLLPARYLSEEVIELTDSDEEPPIMPPASKRRKIIHSPADTIDLTALDTLSLSTSAGHTTLVDDRSGVRAPPEASKDRKTLTDLTNEQTHRSDQPGFSVLDVPVGDEAMEEVPVESYDHLLSQILEVVPDVQPEHARSLLTKYRSSAGENTVAIVLHFLFEHSYPKVERNLGKRKREADDINGESSGKTDTIDYGSKDRDFLGGEHYISISLNQLSMDFPFIPVPHVRKVFQSNNSLYAPTHLFLRQQLKLSPLPFRPKVTPTRSTGKGKHHDAEFERELAWLSDLFKGEVDKASVPLQQEEDDDECEGGIECGCCFSTYAFDKMVQCPDAHLFCKGCMRSYVENQLGQHDPQIKCMDQSGCKLSFADAELKRILSEKLLDLYERIKQVREIEAAGIDGLEECPFCEYKVVIENPDEKLFCCERDECGAVSCRMCKKLDHLPQSCEEAEEEKGLSARHKVEEAMTEALMRNCPKCKKAFIKESGCNKMRCPHCSTTSCYVCRQVIKGYDHFDSNPHSHTRGQGSNSKQKCLLWDSVECRHDQEVAAARERAIKEVENVDPDVDKKQLEVDLPRNAPPEQAAAAVLPRVVMPAVRADMAHYARFLGRDFLHDLEINFNDNLNQMMRALPQEHLQHAPFPKFGPFPQPPLRRQAQPPRPVPMAGAPVMALRQDEIDARQNAVVQQHREAMQQMQWGLRLGQAGERWDARRDAARQHNEEVLRQVTERQQAVRQQYEAQRQQMNPQADIIRNAHTHAPVPFHWPQMPFGQPLVPDLFAAAPAFPPIPQPNLMPLMAVAPAAQPQAPPGPQAQAPRGAVWGP